MNKKIISLIIALTLPITFLVGCKKNQEDFYMTEDTTAIDGSVEYSAKTYKDAFFSTKNYSDEFLQEELNSIIGEIKSAEEKEELVKLLESYTSTNDSGLAYIKTSFEKYNGLKENSSEVSLENNPMYEISSRLYKATLHATKKYYDINDFYIYYKAELSDSNLSEDDLENEIKITAIREYTIANIYKTAYNDSFITNIITDLNGDSNDENVDDKNKEENKKEEITDTPVVENPSTDTAGDNSTDDTYPEFIDLTETVKSQIYDAGVSSAIEFIGAQLETAPSQYARSMYDALENDNPLGNKKEEGYASFLNGFKLTLENNGIEFK
ncbi:MAG: hypothetical protein RSG52_05715 [Terrisporobacter sp.]|uniref:hypothetical protein n=1 Tax=Terrisporobacter sp. TaxID=1965305 RepID=UPI002FCB8AF5